MKKSVVMANANTVNLSFDLSAKMSGILALSTNSCMNANCCKKANSECGCICEFCYARTSINNYSAFRQNITENYVTLVEVLPWNSLPVIDHTEVPFFRFESHGDLFCKEQAINYINIAAYNPLVSFAIWTKNPWHLHEAYKTAGKPVNMRAIYSYYFVVNSDEDLAKAMKRWGQVKKTYGELFDSIFIVLGKEYAKEHANLVNCGARSCYNCHRCYNGNEELIFEVLK